MENILKVLSENHVMLAFAPTILGIIIQNTINILGLVFNKWRSKAVKPKVRKKKQRQVNISLNVHYHSESNHNNNNVLEIIDDVQKRKEEPELGRDGSSLD